MYTSFLKIFILAITFLLISFFQNEIKAQYSSKELRYKEDLWPEISIASVGEKPEVSDTMFVICTIRDFNPKEKRIFGDKIDPANTMRYLLVIRNYNKWKIFMMSSIDEAASYLKKDKDIVFQIEGMGKTFTLNLYRTAGLSLQYNVNVILLDYPSVSLSYSLLKNFNYARNNSLKTTPSFILFLKEMQKYKEEYKDWITNKNSTLFLHSLGNAMLKKGLSENLLKDIKDTLFTSIVLNAACVDQRKHSEWVGKITFAKNIYINYNTNDRQLKFAKWRTGKKQLGACIRKPFVANAKYVSLTRVSGKQHNLFLSKPGGPYIPKAAFNYYYSIFHGKDIEWNNPSKFSENKNNPGKTLSPQF